MIVGRSTVPSWGIARERGRLKIFVHGVSTRDAPDGLFVIHEPNKSSGVTGPESQRKNSPEEAVRVVELLRRPEFLKRSRVSIAHRVLHMPTGLACHGPH